MRAVVSFLLAEFLLLPGPALSQRLWQMATGKNPQNIAFFTLPRDGFPPSYVVVSNADDNSITVIRLLRPSPNSTDPEEVITTLGPIPDPAGLAIYDGLDAGTPHALVVSRSTDQVFLVDLGFPQGIVSRIPAGPRPVAVAASSSLGLAVVSNSGDDSLSVIDLRSRTVVRTIRNIPAATSAHGLGILEARPLAAVASTERSVITVIDLGRFVPIAAFQAGARPVTVEVILGGPQVNVLNSADGTITVLDLNALQQMTVVPLGLRDVLDAAKGYVSTGGRGILLWLGYDFVLPLAPVPPVTAIAGGVVRGATTTNVLAGVIPSLNSIVLLDYADDPLRIRQRGDVALVSGAPAASAVSVGGLATIFLNRPEIGRAQASSTPLPTTLGGVSVLMGMSPVVVGDRVSLGGGTPAAMLFSSSTQLNVQIPPNLPLGPCFFQVVFEGKGLTWGLTNISSLAPAVFTFSTGSQAAALNEDNTANGPTGPLPGLVHPAARGSVIQVFATGAGATDPPLAPGEAAPASGNPLVLTQVQPTVTIGGKNARVLFSGLAPGFVGLWQINAEVPAEVAPGPAVPLVITAAGVSSNTVTIAVQ